jgi:hypothetical protein
MGPRTCPARPALVAAALFLPAGFAVASELGATRSHVAGIVVHDARETLRDFCRVAAGRLWLELPGGSRWELVTSTSDPAIANPGDGAFHAFEAAEVRAALAEVTFPLDAVSAEVFVLPYPRRDGLESAAGPGLVLLSPGVRPLSREHQHAELVHELGHVAQYALLPDADADGWREYARLRGLDPAVHTSSAPHAERPHEIWAEDFRALFGGTTANSTGTIENADLAHPMTVPGLRAFMESRAGAAPHARGPRLLAAPLARGAVTFSRFGPEAPPLDVFDAAGRRLASLAATPGAQAVAWRWDGRDRSGRAVRGSVVFARARDGRGGTARVALAR